MSPAVQDAPARERTAETARERTAETARERTDERAHDTRPDRHDEPRYRADRYDEPRYHAPRPRRRRFLRWTHKMTAVTTAAGLVLVGTVLTRGLDFLPGFGNPFDTRTAERVDPPLLLTIQDLAEFRAASGTFQEVVEIEQDIDNLPDWFAGRKTTFLAVGTVDAVVDFGQLDSTAVQMSADRTVATIRLPKPRLTGATVDPARSRPLDTDRGLTDRLGDALGDGPQGGDRELYLLAQRSIAAAATQSDLQRRAEDNTRRTITALAQSLGFTSVTVEFGTAG
jgi:hypothetical protein